MNTNPILIGSHVSMSGKEMMAGSVREALSYGANTFMLYTCLLYTSDAADE